MDFMEFAINEANKAYELGEVPIGAVIVKENKIIGRGYNLKETAKDVTKHAEMIAICEASTQIGDWRLNGCSMYVTVEPCIMCMGAILQSRLSKLIIGTFNRDMGACGSIINLADNREVNSFIDVIWKYDERCSNLMYDFFKQTRHKY
jgi:tRNA(adenine34) deaminase